MLKQSMIIIMTVRARRRGGYRRGSGKILQLAACALLFLAAAAVRTFELGGDELKNSFLTQLEHSIDLEETIKTIGRAVTLPADTAFKEETVPSLWGIRPPLTYDSLSIAFGATVSGNACV